MRVPKFCNDLTEFADSLKPVYVWIEPKPQVHGQ